MKKIIALFMALLIIEPCFAVTIFQSGKLYGLKDNNSKVILKAEYQKIVQLEYTPVKTILIPMQSTKEPKKVQLKSYKVEKDNLWGVVDDTGKIIIDCRYDDIRVNQYGEIIFKKGDEEILLNPVKNTAKKAAKTVEAIAGLPVTIIAGALLPVEVISKMGKK